MCQCGDNVKVSLLVWRTRYTDTFCNAVDCRSELALEVQRWTRARSEFLLGGGQKLQLRRWRRRLQHGASSCQSISPAHRAFSSKLAARRCCCRSRGQTDRRTDDRPLHTRCPAYHRQQTSNFTQIWCCPLVSRFKYSGTCADYWQNDVIRNFPQSRKYVT